jgi:hypothetical protein
MRTWLDQHPIQRHRVPEVLGDEHPFQELARSFRYELRINDNCVTTRRGQNQWLPIPLQEGWHLYIVPGFPIANASGNQESNNKMCETQVPRF